MTGKGKQNTLNMKRGHFRRHVVENSKVVVVTGVSSGIGWGPLKVLLSNGFRVFGSVRKEADAEPIEIEVTARFGDRVRAGRVLIGTQNAVENDLRRTSLADVVLKIRSKSG
jgi:NAD(P)-dependent dehydrogenase (short-subunit alcohol dehydrogenase family)